MQNLPSIPHTDALLKFIDASPTPLHAVANAAAQLQAAGFRRLDAGEAWTPQAGEQVFFIRDGALVAIRHTRPAAEFGLRMVGAHTDSPCLMVKPNAVDVREGYARLAVEVYGGALLNPWFDRGLGLAGRVVFAAPDGTMAQRLIHIRRPLAVIPSLAIHLDREANTKRAINKQQHLAAVLGLDAGENRMASRADFHKFLATELQREYAAEKLRVQEVFGFDLHLYDCQPSARAGIHGEFIAAARLDNLLSCYAGLTALTAAQAETNQVLIFNNHEEVGSVSASGADGDFVPAVLRRYCGDADAYARALHRSMLISADNAHAVHPNYAQQHEPTHKPRLNAGVVIKVNRNQRYATDAATAAVFQQICARANLPVQHFVTRSDLACGSTLGPIAAANLGVRTLDIGAPQLAMHSIREFAGAYDVPMLITALTEFLQTETLPW